MEQAQKGRIFSLSLAHLFNDWYMNYIQTILPFLVAAGLRVSKGAFLISAFTITSSLMQPVFGYMVDQKNQRWMVYAGTLWMAVLLSVVGLMSSYPLMLLTVALAGLGTAAFHPQASSMVTAVSGERKGFFQALFVAAGNVGWALTPLMMVPLIQGYGLHASILAMLPGVLVGVLLWFTTPRMAAASHAQPPALLPVLRAKGKELAKIVLVVACRSLAYFGLVAFLPLFLQSRNISLLTGSRMLFLMLFAGALGGIGGGYLSDLIGRKAVIAGSLLLSSPLFYLFLKSSGPLSYLFLALAGAALLASFSVTVVLAQEAMGKNAAVASGLMLGFGIGVGGLGVGLLGILAEHAGLPYTINLMILLPCLAGLFALILKTEKAAVVSGQNLEM